MKDLLKVSILIGGVILFTMGIYFINAKVAPVIVAYFGIAGAVAIILYGIFFWRRGKNQ